jgi:hypothetical protein
MRVTVDPSSVAEENARKLERVRSGLKARAAFIQWFLGLMGKVLTAERMRE